MAQAESDSMQYTLPLKQKQIEQSRLEARRASRPLWKMRTPPPERA